MDKDMIHSLTSIFNGIEESDDNDIMGLPTPSMDEEYLTQYNQCVLDQHFKIYYEDENENIIKVGGRLSDKNFEQELYTPKLSDYLPKQNKIEEQYVDIEAKLESTKRKIHNNYQKMEQKKHTTIKLSEEKDFSKKIKALENNKADDHLCDKKSQTVESNTQKILDHLPKNKLEKQSVDFEAKLESTKRKLHNSYQKIEQKKHKSIKLSEVNDFSKKIKVPESNKAREHLCDKRSQAIEPNTQKFLDHLPKNKPEKQQSINLEAKLESTKQKLHDSYQKIEKKKHQSILLSEVKDYSKKIEVPKIIRSSLQVKQKTLKLPNYVPKQDKSEKQSVEDETKLESTKRKQMEQKKHVICMKQQNIDLETKLESTKQKLHNSYQKIEQKKHKIIQLLEVKDLPRTTETKRRCSWHRR
ncbi:uncharacterized protein LOC115696765 [Cannabis sativa]|uniref:uncharacterized protein LOC115696765 n=1 Tax=Cannabis sativa TaxID=3483 RepID=UPI0029CA0963|nr:uncharacterized protein LOC115696765 [Cannabis sativa]